MEGFYKELDMLGKVASLSLPKEARKLPYSEWGPT